MSDGPRFFFFYISVSFRSNTFLKNIYFLTHNFISICDFNFNSLNYCVNAEYLVKIINYTRSDSNKVQTLNCSSERDASRELLTRSNDSVRFVQSSLVNLFS